MTNPLSISEIILELFLHSVLLRLHLFDIWGSHSGGDVSFGLLGFNTEVGDSMPLKNVAV
jgi:hypothetical protein